NMPVFLQNFQKKIKTALAYFPRFLPCSFLGII
ncbi:MAG: hypothetical protein ACI920_003705, partial [Saprospiraceae bacterium]